MSARVAAVHVTVEDQDGRRTVTLEALHAGPGVVFVAVPEALQGTPFADDLAAQLRRAGVELVVKDAAFPLSAWAHKGIVVSCILGHTSADDLVAVHEARAAKLREAGFVRFERDARHHGPGTAEMFVLSGPWAAKGPIAGMDLARVRAWLMQEVQPGVIEVVAEHWGMGPG